MNLGLLLKMLGVKVTPEQIAMIEAIIPQIPGRIQQAVTVINGSLQNFDQRLKAIEEALAAQNALLIGVMGAINGRQDDGDSAIPAGIGATQRAYNGRTDR